MRWGNEELLAERDWIYSLLDEYEDLEITDTGLGMGQADLAYERDYDDNQRIRVSITMKLEEEC